MKNEDELNKIIEEVNGTQTSNEQVETTPGSQEEAENIEPILTDEEKKKREYQKQALLDEYAKNYYNELVENNKASGEIFKQLAEQNYNNQEFIEQVRKIKRIYEAVEITRQNKEPIYICNDIDNAIILENNGKNAIFTELNKKVNDKYIKTSYIKEITGK